MNLCQVQFKSKITLLSILVALTFALLFVGKASAHGYVTGPDSRASLCAKGINVDCGAIVYEPQSLEAPGNFPNEGPADGKIASAGGAFPKLDEQSENRWAKVPMTSGANTFSWNLTAAHATEKWDYYITKENWDPNSPLKRSDFELFCSINDGGKRPPFQVSHDCVVPERTGYHVILAYWEIADTANAFYNVIDANFDGGFVEPGNPEGPGNGGDDGNGNIPAWDASAVYLAGNKVTYNGATYEAKWWTQGDTPGSSSVWQLLGSDPGGGDGSGAPADAWSANKVYLGGDIVTYEGSTYKAKWWTQGEKPGTSSVWVKQ